jgi:hypothetical protein
MAARVRSNLNALSSAVLLACRFRVWRTTIWPVQRSAICMNFRFVRNAAVVLILGCLLRPWAGMPAESGAPPFLYAAEGAQKIIVGLAVA